MDPWSWALILLLVGFALVLLEAFIPSGGILGFLAAAAIVGAIVLAFNSGPSIGMLFLIVALLLVPMLIIFALKLWPRTPIGKHVLLASPKEEDVMVENLAPERLEPLIGELGHAKYRMIPSGLVTIGKEEHEATCENGLAEIGQPIKVVGIRNNRLLVQLVEGEEPATDSNDPLNQPIDEVLDEPFEIDYEK